MMTGLATVALGVSALLASGAMTSAQTGETATPTPAATEKATDDSSTATPDPSDDTDSSDADSQDDDGGRRGCGGGKRLIKDAAAEVLGLSEEDLIAALQDGQTLAEVAAAQGMSEADLKAALVTSVTADLQAQLDAGEVTQEQFDEITADLGERIDDIINREGGIRFHQRFGDDANEDVDGTGARFRVPFQSAPVGSDA